MTIAVSYVCLSEWSLGLALAAAYSNAARGRREERVEVCAAGTMRTATTVSVAAVGSFLILFIKVA